MSEQSARPNLRDLESLALAQGGYFDRRDAHAHGLSDRLLHHHARSGRFERLFPGVYRLTHAPVAPRDDLLQAWVWSNYRGAISHDSALALYDLADVMPTRVHLTVPPEFRRSPSPFILHRSRLAEDDVTLYDGVRVTTPARSIVDAAADGTGPEQIEKAVQQALARALAAPVKLRTAARRARYRHRRTVLPMINAAIEHAAT